MALARTPQPAPARESLLGWWLDELLGLLPSRWRAPRARRHGLVLLFEEPFVHVYAQRRRRLAALGTIQLPGPKADPASVIVEPKLKRAFQRHKGDTLLLLASPDGLTCPDVLPAAAENDLDRIMAHKIDLLTPWPAAQVYSAQRVTGRHADGMLEVLLAVVPRARLDQILTRLGLVGIRPASVDLAVDEEATRAGIDLLRAGAPERRGRRLLQLTLLLGVAAALAAAGWTGYRAFQLREQVATRNQFAAALDERLADLPELRARIEARRQEMGFVDAQRRARPSALLVLETLSRLLPDGVWLTELQLDGGELIVTGLAEDASGLVALVEGAPQFQGVRFNQSSTRTTAAGPDGREQEYERFSLRMQVQAPIEVEP